MLHLLSPPTHLCKQDSRIVATAFFSNLYNTGSLELLDITSSSAVRPIEMVLKVVLFLVATTLWGQSLAGLLNSFSADNDFTAAYLMDSMFGIVTNNTKSILNGDSTNPIEVDVKFFCGNR